MRQVVVGSGITGMTAALLLARQGHEVILLEAAPQPAPLLRGFQREGLRFDTGFHYGGGLHEGGVLRCWLRALGVEKHLTASGPWDTAGHQDVFRFPDGSTWALPTGEKRTIASVERQFPGHGEDMRVWLRRCAQALSHSPYTNPSLEGDPALWRGSPRSVADHLRDMRLPPALEAMLGMRCLLYGTPPDLAAWDDYALVAGPYFQSCGTWPGGGRALAEALLAELAEAGAAVRRRTHVTALDADTTTGLRGVILADGEYIACAHCVFTGHPRQLESLLAPGRLRRAYCNRIRQMPETWPALMLFAETDALPPGYSLFLPPPVEKCLGNGLFAPLDAASPCMYLHCGHPADDTRNQQRLPLLVLCLTRPSPPEDAAFPRSSGYTAAKQEAVDRLAALAEWRCPELRGRWRVLDAATEHSLRRWVPGGTGSLYGLRHDTENMPLLPVTRVPGLLLAGQNILLPGVLGGIVSAALAVGFALGHDAALKEFRACAANV